MKRFFGFLLAVCAVLLVLLFVGFAVLPAPGNVPVLMYHFIGTEGEAAREKNFVSKESFAAQMAFLHLMKYRVITLKEYEDILSGKRKPQGREVAITFDDGNYSFEDGAYPILQKYHFPVTLFVVSESVKRGLGGSMSADTLKKFMGEGLVSVQSHTKTHPLLSKLKANEEISEELLGSKEDLEEILGTPVDYLAYPSGDVDSRVLGYAEQAGYKLAFTTSYKKLKGLPEGPMSLSRVKITRSSDNPLLFWFKVSGIYQFFKHERYRLTTS